MPVGTPMVKIENTKRHGAIVFISGQTLEESGAFAREHAKSQGLMLIHPYDDPLVIAGQGTAALEMLKAAPAAGHAGDPDRRRRPDLRHGDCGQIAQARAAHHRRGGRALSVHVQCHQGCPSADAQRHAGEANTGLAFCLFL
jgi:hypothetical protein